MQSLREKLLKAGLITEKDATRAEAARPSQRPQAREAPHAEAARPAQRPHGRPQAQSARAEAPIPKLPPLAVPNNKEFQRLESKKQVELDRRIRELVQGAQVAPEGGGHTFYFVTRKNRLRRLELSDRQAVQLEQGELAVVERPDPGQIDHALVPAKVAEQVFGLQERSVRFFNRPGTPVGFLSDEELTSRQRTEAEGPAEEEAQSVEGPPAGPTGDGAEPGEEATG